MAQGRKGKLPFTGVGSIYSIIGRDTHRGTSVFSLLVLRSYLVETVREREGRDGNLLTDCPELTTVWLGQA